MSETTITTQGRNGGKSLDREIESFKQIPKNILRYSYGHGSIGKRQSYNMKLFEAALREANKIEKEAVWE